MNILAVIGHHPPSGFSEPERQYLISFFFLQPIHSPVIIFVYGQIFLKMCHKQKTLLRWNYTEMISQKLKADILSKMVCNRDTLIT